MVCIKLFVRMRTVEGNVLDVPCRIAPRSR